MKDGKDMNIKIQNAAMNGERNNGSCRKLAEYLNHEDAVRMEAGKTPVPFATADGLKVSTEEVIGKIDRNHSHLSKKDDKFIHMVISPSRAEIDAMGETEKELYRSAQKLIQRILDCYAENFNRDEVTDHSDLVAYWKPHYTRDKDGDHQFHIHAIISRKSRPDAEGKSVKISPFTNHRNTKDGPVKGGFDRKAFYTKGERIFDKLFNYERSVAETFEYNNIMAHGSPEEKAEQAWLLTEEHRNAFGNAVKAGIARRKKNLQDKAEVEEIATAISQAPLIATPGGKDPVADAFDHADISVKIRHIFEVSSSKDALDLNLLAAGVTMSIVTGKNGGVSEIVFVHRGRKLPASDIMDSSGHQRLLFRWETISGQAPEAKIEARMEAVKAERLVRQVSQVNPPRGKIGRGL